MIRSEADFIGRPVLSLQSMLRTLYPSHPPLPMVATDGIFDEATLETVMVFQRENGLPVTGVVDAPTWDAIVSHYHAALDRRDGSPFLTEEIDTEGSLSLPMAQSMFEHLALFVSVPQRSVLPGTGNDAVRANLRWLQALSLLPETGDLDWRTSRVLNNLYLLTLGARTR